MRFGDLGRAHFPLITHEADSIAPTSWIIVLQAVNAHANVGVDVADEIITVFDSALDDRCAIDLVHFVVHHGRLRWSIRSKTIGIAFREIRYDERDITSIMVNTDTSG